MAKKNEVLQILKIQTVNNRKIQMIVDYIEKNNIDITSYPSAEMDSKSVFAFICAMNSIKNTVELLFNGNNTLLHAINTRPLAVADFFNIYGIDCSFIPTSNMEVLLSKEYLKLAPIEWTRKNIFENNTYYLRKHGKGYTVAEDKLGFFETEWTHDYVNVFDENVTALKEAKNEKELNNMIKKLSDANI
jgi:hypothetical protein